VAGMTELFAIERKTISDLIACSMGQNRARFERELHRLRGYRFKRLLIVGTELEVQQGAGYSRINPKSVFGSLSAWECRYDLPVVWRDTPEAAAREVERWVFYFARELVEAVNDLWRAANVAPMAKGE
jgi:DNA excision repair protein ERCC-4